MCANPQKVIGETIVSINKILEKDIFEIAAFCKIKIKKCQGQLTYINC